MVELSGIEAQPASKASGKKRSAVQWKAGSKLWRAIPHVDGGAERDRSPAREQGEREKKISGSMESRQ